MPNYLKMLGMARSYLDKEKHSVVVVTEKPRTKDSVKKYAQVSSDTDGIKALIELLDKNGAVFENSSVADKTIGKAAAMVLVANGAKMVYGTVMSEAARTFCEENDIFFTYTTLVDKIKNKDKTDICPFEKAVEDLDDPKLALDVVKKTLAGLKG